MNDWLRTYPPKPAYQPEKNIPYCVRFGKNVIINTRFNKCLTHNSNPLCEGCTYYKREREKNKEQSVQK